MPPRSVHGTPTAMKKRLNTEIKRLADMTADDQKARVDELVELAAPTLRGELAQYGVTEDEDQDRGILLVMLMHMLKLGLPPESEWTVESVKFVLTTLYQTPWTRAQVNSKANACRTLRKVVQDAEESNDDDEEESSTDPSVAKRLFKSKRKTPPTPQTEEDAEKEEDTVVNF